MDTSAVTVRNNPGRHRYELLDGGTVIGTADWVPFEGADGPQRIFHHTSVDEAYGGQGLGSRLAREALDDTAAAGLPVVPVCPYIKKWLRTHQDHPAVRVPVQPEHLAAVPRQEQQ
ncbi:GNAT family N-acetyltransferase [Kocuria sp. CPCC 205292]|uniref:GNAT family N-acetyltransferase n=1 Tax=Kocuria cellulosilytica TaxID=3071451 RepID=UPI0034D59598